MLPLPDCVIIPAMRILADARKVSVLVQKLAGLIAQGIAADQSGCSWAIIGIRSRGDLLAQRLAKQLNPDHLGSLDITLYRDDLSEIGNQAVVRTTDVPFSIDGVNVVLVDDVLMTGRSVRAALQSLTDLGRPRRVWLAVLADRGGRELPIQPDFTALDLTARSRIKPEEMVDVYLEPADKLDAVVVRRTDERTQ